MQPLWPALFVCGALALAVYVAARNYPWGDDKVEFWLGSFAVLLSTGLLCGLAGALGFGLASVIGQNSDQVWHECWRAKIVSLRTADSARGSVGGGVFMVVGQFGPTQVYYYYTDNGGNSYRPQKWEPNSRTTIFEEDRKDGEVVQFECAFKRGAWMKYFAEPFDSLRMDFHVPTGSIKQQFELK